MFLEPDDQVAVDFDDMQMIDTRHQRLGNCPQPWANFDDGFIAPGVHGRHDGGDDAGIDQKILTEAFSGNMALHGIFLVAIRAASATASSTLPGSALPVPANASAVP